MPAAGGEDHGQCDGVEAGAIQRAVPGMGQAGVFPEVAIALVMVVVFEGVPQLPSRGFGDGLDAKRTQVGQRRRDLRLRVGGGGPCRRGRHVADAVLPYGRQRQDAVALQRLQHPEASPDPVVSLLRRPAEMLADGLREFVAAVVGKQLDGLPDVGDLLPVQAAAREGGRLEVDHSLVHGRFPHLPDSCFPEFAGFCHNQVSDVEFVRGVSDLVTTTFLTPPADGRLIEAVQTVMASTVCCLFGNARNEKL